MLKFHPSSNNTTISDSSSVIKRHQQNYKMKVLKEYRIPCRRNILAPVKNNIISMFLISIRYSGPWDSHAARNI